VESSPAPDHGGYAYPLYRRNDRALDAEYTGPLYVWDIDNTYLISEYQSIRDLIRIRFESALDKTPVPGAVQLLHAIRRGGADDTDGLQPPIYFVSASPEGMRPVLTKRMLLDGVAHDGMTFRNLHKLRYVRDIFGYKIVALLLYRLENPKGAQEVLFGDDREHDLLVYTLYRQICAGELRGDALRECLSRHGVRRSASGYAAAIAEPLPKVDPVEWVFIRRIAGRPKVGEPAPADDCVVYVDDYAQAAALLLAQERIMVDGFRAVLGAVRDAGQALDVAAVIGQRAERFRPEALAVLRSELTEEER
jgi:hypothetical protein